MTFLEEPARRAGQERLYAEDLVEDGYVSEVIRVCVHQPEANERLIRQFAATTEDAVLTSSDKAMIVIAQAAATGDSYRAVAWANGLTDWADPESTITTLTADDEPYSAREQALPAWTRTIAHSPGAARQTSCSASARRRIQGASSRSPDCVLRPAYGFLQHQHRLGARPDVALMELSIRPCMRPPSGTNPLSPVDEQ